MPEDLKVNELGSPLTPLDGTELLYVVDGSTDRQTTTQDVADLGGNVSHVGSAVVPGNLTQYAQTDGGGIEDSGYSAQDLIDLIDAVDSAVNTRMPVPHRHVASDIVGLEAGGGGHVIEDEGTPVTQQTNLNFVGAGVSVADSGGKTVVTISGGGSGDDFLTVQAFS